MKDLQGRVIIITGGGQGIGRETASFLAEKGARIAIIEKNKILKGVIKKIAKDSKQVKYYVCDITKFSQVKSTFKKIADNFGKIDILVNNAGVSTFKKIEDLTEKDWDYELDVNLKGVYICSTIVYPYMAKNKRGWIVNVASERGRSGSPDSSPAYAAAKAGVINITKSYAKQLAKYNIRVNCVAPAAISGTSLSRNWSEDLKKEIVKNIPLGRLGEPSDVAKVVYFLISDLSSFMTGVTIDTNGGFSMY